MSFKEDLINLIMEALPSILIAVLIVLLIIIMMNLKRVPHGMEYNVERFGRYVRTLKSGLHFIFPAIEVISEKVNMMEQVVNIPQQEIITRDNAIFSADGVISFQVIDASRTTYREKHLYYIIVANINNVIGSTDLDELLLKPNETNAHLLALMNNTVRLLGIKISYIKIKYIDPPRNLVNVSDSQIKVEPENDKKIKPATVENPIATNKKVEMKKLEPIGSQLIRDVRIYMAKENFNLNDFGMSTLYSMLQPYLDEEVESKMHFVGLGGRPSGGAKKLKADILDNITRLENA